VAVGSEDFITLDEFVKRAIQQDKDHLIQLAGDLGFDNWRIPLFNYSIRGNREKNGLLSK
jgi:hypothetical protein